jgi:hypothetical protein
MSFLSRVLGGGAAAGAKPSPAAASASASAAAESSDTFLELVRGKPELFASALIADVREQMEGLSAKSVTTGAAAQTARNALSFERAKLSPKDLILRETAIADMESELAEFKQEMQRLQQLHDSMEAARAYAASQRMFDPVSAGARVCTGAVCACAKARKVGCGSYADLPHPEPSQISENEIAKAFVKGSRAIHTAMKMKFGSVCMGVLRGAIASAAKDDESEEGGERESGKKAKRG